MSVFDFLKIIVSDKKPAAKKAARSPNSGSANTIEFDNKSYPLAAVTTKGLVVGGFDGSLVKGQTARITVKINDPSAKITFTTTIAVNEVTGDKMVGEWTLLDPQIEAAIRAYAQRRKQKPAGR